MGDVMIVMSVRVGEEVARKYVWGKGGIPTRGEISKYNNSVNESDALQVQCECSDFGCQVIEYPYMEP